MAEQIQHKPSQARQRRPQTEAELERLEGRLAEINGLLDELYATGIIRWLKDFVAALPQVSEIALGGLDSERGHAGLRNLLIVGRQLGRVDPDRLQAILDSAELALTRREQSDSPYNPPGLTGAWRLLHDDELWASIAPLIAAAKAFSAAGRAGDDADRRAGGAG